MADLARLPMQIQALLYAEGGSVSFSALAKSLATDDAAVRQGCMALATALEGSGLALITSDTEATLVVSAAARDVVIEKARSETERDIGDAGLEVLAILLYEGPSTRADIDYIRGVNSSSTIRNLLSRGLVERAGNPADAREYVYRPTTELIAHLGATAREKLPDYATISAELAAFKATENKEHGPGTGTTGGQSDPT